MSERFCLCHCQVHMKRQAPSPKRYQSLTNRDTTCPSIPGTRTAIPVALRCEDPNDTYVLMLKGVEPALDVVLTTLCASFDPSAPSRACSAVSSSTQQIVQPASPRSSLRALPSSPE